VVSIAEKSARVNEKNSLLLVEKHHHELVETQGKEHSHHAANAAALVRVNERAVENEHKHCQGDY
jgi:hypothetical protein